MRRFFIPLAGLFLLTLVVFLVFLQHPGLGDDFSYWKVGYGLANGVSGAYRAGNFHDLRWPIWGACWAIQTLTGSSMLAYYGVPFFLMWSGTAIVFWAARWLGFVGAGAWGAAGMFLLHPLADAVSYRPMPDLGEGLWMGCAVLGWWGAVQDGPRWRRVVCGVLAGGAVGLAHSNRFTGLLIVPMLGVMTLVLCPRRWPWTLLVLGVGAGMIGAECLFYKGLTGDILHSLHTNMGAKGKKGTEAVFFLLLPFRFLDSLWKAGGKVLGPVYFLSAIAGGWMGWRRGGAQWRLMVAWAVVGFLAYSCALQQVWPPRPMLRDAERFLAALCIPLALLSAKGIELVWLEANSRGWLRRIGYGPQGRISATALVVGGLCVVALLSSRRWFNMDFIPEFRRYVGSSARSVLTHESMWYFTQLVAQKEARTRSFVRFSSLWERRAALEEALKNADEVWYVRELTLLRTRKNLEENRMDAVSNLSSFFDAPQGQWKCVELLKVEQKPEVVFYQRRGDGAREATVLQAAEIPGLPSLPLRWDLGSRAGTLGQHSFEVPPSLRGRRLRIRAQGSSDVPQPFELTLELLGAGRRVGFFEMAPVFGKQSTPDFFNVEIPPEAETARVRLGGGRKGRRGVLEALEFVAD
jgi:hypothetical protein